MSLLVVCLEAPQSAHPLSRDKLALEPLDGGPVLDLRVLPR